MAIFVYITASSDSSDKRQQAAALSDDAEELRRVSHALEDGNRIWTGWASSNGGEMVSAVGDEFRIRIPAEKLRDLPELRRQYEEATNTTLSVGIGSKMSEADRALMAAKLTGGDKVRLYDPGVEEELKNAPTKTDAQEAGEEYLGKSEYKSAAFKDENGKIHPTGSLHDVEELPPEVRDTKLEPGFVTHDDQFVAKSDLKKAAPETGANRGGFRHAAEADVQEAEGPSPDEDRVPMADRKDRHAAFHAIANEQSKKDIKIKQDDDQQAQDQGATNQLKQQVVSVLKVMKERSQELEQIKEADPELYKSLVGMLQSMIAMAKDKFAAPVQKSELNKNTLIPQQYHALKWDKRARTVLAHSGKPSIMYANPSPRSGDITALEWLPSGGLHVHYTPEPWHQLRSAHDYMGLIPHHQKELQADFLSHTGLSPEEHEADKQAIMTGRPLYKEALQAGKTGHFQVKYPVGSQVDSGPFGGRRVGRMKIMDPATGKTKWRQVRAGIVMAEDGTPTSSRNQSNDGKDLVNPNNNNDQKPPEE